MSIDEKGYVLVGGIQQWMTIKGANRANPVVLFVHGGPGNPMSQYADALYQEWEKDFTIVQWDQRGIRKIVPKPINPSESSRLRVSTPRT